MATIPQGFKSSSPIPPKDAPFLRVPFLRTPYNYDADAVALETATFCRDPHLTVQDQVRDCDINEIVKRFTIQDLTNQVKAAPFADVSILPNDYQEALNLVLSAEDAFDALPVAVRDRFGYNPGAVLAFVSDNRNYDEAVKLGLVRPKEAVEPATHKAGAKTASKGQKNAPVEASEGEDE